MAIAPTHVRFTPADVERFSQEHEELYELVDGQLVPKHGRAAGPSEEPSRILVYVTPDLVAEVVAAPNTWDETRGRVEEYLAYGIPIVYVLEPGRRVNAYRQDGFVWSCPESHLRDAGAGERRFALVSVAPSLRPVEASRSSG